MSEPMTSLSEKILALLLIGVIGAFAAFIFWAIGTTSGEDSMKLKALENKVACFIPDTNGKPRFAWLPECEKWSRK